MTGSLHDNDDDMLMELDIKNVLLVDDDSQLSEVLKALLEAHNYIVVTAKNGVEALKEVMNLDFDVILCDLMMPNMPGDMFYLAVERTKPFLCDRFIFVTAHSNDLKMNTFLENSRGSVLLKPFNTDDLIKAIGMVLKSNNRK